MNLKWIQRVVDAYRRTVDGETASRLDFYGEIWKVQAEAEKKAGKACAYDVGAVDELERAYWSNEPIVSAFPVAVDASLLADTAAAVARAIAEAPGMPEQDGALLKSWDWEAIVGGAPVELAGRDPQGFLAQAADAAARSVGDQAPLVGLVLSMALKPLLEPAARAVDEALGDRLAKGCQEHFGRTECPFCGGEAALAYIGPTPSGVDNGRQLWCGQCGTLWEFERVRCPRCGSQMQTQLHYTSVEGDDEHRIYHCDVCHGYVRTVFSTGMAGVGFSPEVEDVVMVNLDAIARSRGLGPR